MDRGGSRDADRHATPAPEDRSDWPKAPAHIEPFIIQCCSCGDAVGPEGIALDFGYRCNGERWTLGYCTACMTNEQKAWLDRKADLWVASYG